jgi:hypothetical protein
VERAFFSHLVRKNRRPRAGVGLPSRRRALKMFLLFVPRPEVDGYR